MASWCFLPYNTFPGALTYNVGGEGLVGDEGGYGGHLCGDGEQRLYYLHHRLNANNQLSRLLQYLSIVSKDSCQQSAQSAVISSHHSKLSAVSTSAVRNNKQ